VICRLDPKETTTPMSNATNETHPIDKRCREAHPEYIRAGDITWERNDTTAKRYGETERTTKRGRQARRSVPAFRWHQISPAPGLLMPGPRAQLIRPSSTASAKLRAASLALVWGLESQAENSRHAFFLRPNFFVRLESPFLRPDPQRPNAVARRGCQGWPSLRYLLMAPAMPGHTLTGPSTAARSL
jgi:hypothetical protein